MHEVEWLHVHTQLGFCAIIYRSIDTCRKWPLQFPDSKSAVHLALHLPFRLGPNKQLVSQNLPSLSKTPPSCVPKMTFSVIRRKPVPRLDGDVSESSQQPSRSTARLRTVFAQVRRLVRKKDSGSTSSLADPNAL